MWICGDLRVRSAARVRSLSTLGLTDLSDRLAHVARVPSSGQLRRNKDADQFPVLGNRQAPHLTLGHELLRLVVAGVWRDPDRVRAHYRADRGRFWILPGS